MCVFVCRHVVRTRVESIAMDCSSVLRMFRICEREPELIDGKKEKKLLLFPQLLESPNSYQWTRELTSAPEENKHSSVLIVWEQSRKTASAVAKVQPINLYLRPLKKMWDIKRIEYTQCVLTTVSHSRHLSGFNGAAAGLAGSPLLKHTAVTVTVLRKIKAISLRFQQSTFVICRCFH